MRIEVDTIKRDGRQIQLGLADAWAARAARGALESAPTALTGTLSVTRQAGNVQVAGALSATTDLPCDRCGEPVSTTVQTPVALTYLPATAADDAEVELSADDLDVGFLEEGALDLGQVVSEALALALPSRTLCNDTQACDLRTQALLDEAVEHAGALGHPGFAGLAKLVSN